MPIDRKNLPDGTKCEPAPGVGGRDYEICTTPDGTKYLCHKASGICESFPARSEPENRKELAELAERSLKLAMALPDELTCRKNFTAHEANFLSALRNLAVSLSMARTWSDSEARSRFESLDFANAAFDYALQLALDNGGGATDTNCAIRCKSQFDACKQNCDSYTCFLDCRIAYYACIAQCVMRGVTSGGIIIY